MARLSILLALLLDAASAHTIMNQVSVNGKSNAQGVGIYMPSSNMYQSDVLANTMACNGDPATGFKASSEVIAVNAGDTVTGAWLHELTSTGADSSADNKVLASSHKGPVLAYMKKVADATQNPSAGPGDGWFKVAEAGLISSSEWAVDKLIADGGLQTVKIPTCLASGDYLLRFEIIALHSAGSANGAQFYMECAQLRVTGAASPQTPTTVKIPGVYTANDPGILVSIYNSQGQPYPASYKVPGPAVFQCAAGAAVSASSSKATSIVASVSTAAPTTKVIASTNAPVPTSKVSTAAPAPTTKATTVLPALTTFQTVTSLAKPATSSATAISGSGSVAKWGQCGGKSYTGKTECVSGSTCQVQNDWYFQCL